MAAEVIVVGGGPTGLIAAWLLTGAGRDVRLFEAGPEPGGALMCTDVNGEPVERLYHHLLPADEPAVGLIDRLGLSGGLRWLKGSTAAWDGTRLHPLSGLADMLRFGPLTPLERVRALWGMLRAAACDPRDLLHVPAYRWLPGVLGDAAWHKLWQPLLKNRWGELAEAVPGSWLAWRMQQRSAGGMGRFGRYGVLDGGTAALIDRLARRIRERGGSIRTSAPVRAVRKIGAGWRVEGDWGYAEAAKVILAVPPLALNGIDGDVPDVLRDSTRGLKTLSVATALVEADGPFTGHYWINTIKPGAFACGAVEHTNLVDAARYGGRHLAHVPVYAAADDPRMRLADDELSGKLCDELLEISAVRPLIKRVRLFRYDAAHTLRTAEFVLGLPELVKSHGGLVWASDVLVWPEDRGLAACVAAAEAAVKLAAG